MISQIYGGIVMKEILSNMIQDSVGGCAKYWADLIADHLLDEGVIVPPCKVGDVVWVLNRSRGAIYGNKVVCIKVRGESPNKNTIRVEHHNRVAEASYRKYTWSQFGKQVFLSKEEAEKALSEGNENED
jgi:hypothetical protein